MISSLTKSVLGIYFKHSPPIKNQKRQGVTCFVFHEVSDEPSEFAKDYGLSLSKKAFLRQASWIKKHFNVIKPSQLSENTTLPENSAIITFDDGFEGTFKNGIEILGELNLPAIVFLNMKTILTGKPMLSAVTAYFEKFEPSFIEFARANNLSKPLHLTANPKLIYEYLNQSPNINWQAIKKYQGPLICLDALRTFEDEYLVEYGNHLFDHWNAKALSPVELEDQFTANQKQINSFRNGTKLFAFTNGKPGTCFSPADIGLINGLGASKAFSAVGGVNKDPRSFLLGRVATNFKDVSENHLWFRIGMACRP